MTAYEMRANKEDEGDRLRAVLNAEHYASRERIAAAMRDAALGLMEWRDPSELTPGEYRQLGAIPDRHVYRPYDPQGDVEPYDIQSDWNERGI